jgi:hypothetical protein
VTLHKNCYLPAQRTRANSQNQYHNESVLRKYAPKLKVGEVKEEAKL